MTEGYFSKPPAATGFYFLGNGGVENCWQPPVGIGLSFPERLEQSSWARLDRKRPCGFGQICNPCVRESRSPNPGFDGTPGFQASPLVKHRRRIASLPT
jgi:hypothetical protein